MSRAETFSHSGPLHGSVRVPGDKSISHRGLMLGALAEGVSYVSGLSNGDDVLRTRLGLSSLGIEFVGEEIHGGRSKMCEAERPIDVGNSGTCMRLMSGLLASLPFLSVLVGDQSIHRRPMDRISTPLRQMGASIDGRDGGRLAPLVVRGGSLHGIDYRPPVASAQVKGSIMFAGLGADGETTVREAIATRLHSEELFALAGADVRSGVDDAGYYATVSPGSLRPFRLDVPGDPSQAAFFVVAASIVPDSDIVVENVYVGQGRANFIEVLKRMGADIELVHRDETAADIHVRYAPLRATDVRGSEVPGLIDEIPVLAVAAACAEGCTTFADAAELRVKESDRIETICAGLGALGADVVDHKDGLSITGPMLSTRGVVKSEGDHRIAMALAIAALTGHEPVTVEGFESVDTSWPGFVEDLASLS